MWYIILHKESNQRKDIVMSNIEYLKAGENDFEELIDFTNLVFSAFSPNDFEVVLPALYKKENISTGTNYIVKENGRIVANVGAYPVDYYICGDTLKTSAITCVAAHPRARLKGYMKELMEMGKGDGESDATDYLSGRSSPIPGRRRWTICDQVSR